MPNEAPVYIAIPAEMYSEFIVRSGKHINVALFIEGIVEQYLDRTRGDAGIWSEAHADEVAEEEEAQGEREKNGDPRKGYQWQTVFLPNGTKIRMLYQGQQLYAAIQHEKLVYEGESLSPSEFASKAARGTNRNAWRDLYLQFPDSRDWEQADVVRKQRAGAPRR